MPRPVSNGAILEVANEGRVFGETLMNVWHYRWEAPTVGSVDGDLLTDALAAQIQPVGPFNLLKYLREMCNEAVTWDRVRYQWIHPIRYVPWSSSEGFGAGTVVGNAMPSNVCGVVSLVTPLAILGGKGRKHFGGLSDQDIFANTMGQPWTAVAESIAQFMGQIRPTVAVSPESKFVPIIYNRAAPGASQMWTEYFVRTTARVMRRRTAGVGQ